MVTGFVNKAVDKVCVGTVGQRAKGDDQCKHNNWGISGRAVNQELYSLVVV